MDFFHILYVKLGLMKKNIFITGTDTDVGKTIVTAGLALIGQNLGYKTGVYKPFQSGCMMDGEIFKKPDPDFIQSLNPDVVTKSSYNFLHPSAPILAASLENVAIEPEKILHDYNELDKSCDFVIVEGAGGLLVPVYKDLLIRDFIKLLNLPLIVVAKPDLGTINHSLLTIEAAKNSGIEVLGIIISNYPENTDDLAIKTAPDYIKEFSGVDILGILPKIDNLNHNNLLESTKKNILINKIFS